MEVTEKYYQLYEVSTLGNCMDGVHMWWSTRSLTLVHSGSVYYAANPLWALFQS